MPNRDTALFVDACLWAVARDEHAGRRPRRLTEPVQLGTPAGNWVIDALAVSSLEPLRPILEGPETTLVIQYAHFERRILGKAGFTLTSVFDTWAASRKKHGHKALGGHSLAAVAERELGVIVSKEQQTSNWARRPLSIQQVRYAALDAELMIDLHAVLA